MSGISFIVDKLNQKPFSRDFTLVSFDELSPFELLELLNDVLVYLEPQVHNVDLREETTVDGATGTRIADFLRILQYSVPSNVDQFKQQLSRGDRNAIYPVLHYLLSRLEPMKTRAYLARYLKNVEIPPAFLHDETIQEVYQHYKSLQGEFKETHKSLEQLRHNTMQPGELKREIFQLEEEKSQLLEKISSLERKTANMQGFEELYQVTSALRREQEEESKVQDQAREQHAALELAENRMHDTRQQLEELQAAQREESPSELLERLEREVSKNRQQLEYEVPKELDESYERLGELEKELSAPVKSQSDVAELDARVARMHREIDSMQDQLDRARRRNGGDDKLKMFRQQQAMMTKKLAEKEEQVQDATSELEQMDRELAAAERDLAKESNKARHGVVGGVGPGGRQMSKSDFKKYATQLRKKTSEYKSKKEELAALRAETVVLHRTETIMRTRGENVEEFLREVERGAGVEGAGDVERELASVSKQAANLNKNKKLTLEEISGIVRQLKDTLAKRKKKLEPQIARLRSVRDKFKELEVEYLEKKSVYENTAVGLESERIKLENDCNAFQQECIREESRFHHLGALTEIANAKLNRVQDELSYQKGEGRLLRDFKSYKDLYSQKIQQQEQLSKELRKKQKALKENASDNSEQRQMFVDLKRLLSVKTQVKSKENQRYNEAMNNNQEVYDMGHDVGGANIMTVTH